MDQVHTALHRVVREARAGIGPHPVVVLLHGRGADEYDLLDLADFLDPRCFIVSVRAPLALGPGYAWYDLQYIDVLDRATFDYSMQLLDQLWAELPQRYPIDPQQIYTLGFSQGAMMAGTMRLLAPASAAGTILLSGYLPLSAQLPFKMAELSGTAFFVGHGSQDPVVPVEFAQQTQRYLSAAGADLTYHEYPMGHEIVGPELAQITAWLHGRLATTHT